jgi:hypothetical protein
MNGGKQGTRGRAPQVRDAIASLDVLAAQLRTRGWTAYLATPPGRLASLVVEDPQDCAQCSDIVAAPGGAAGDLWYWFSWGERIASADAPAAAADAIIGARPDARVSRAGPAP